MSKAKKSDAPVIGIAIHGGASCDDEFTRRNEKYYKESLEHICMAGYSMLGKRRSALETVFEVLSMLEDEPLFNSGRGSALNEHGEVHMDAAVMEGKELRAGAVALLQKVKNPSALIREILKEAETIFMAGEGAVEMARIKKLELMPAAYFITDRQLNNYLAVRNIETVEDKLRRKMKGTTGVVVTDKWANVAAGTSTGGMENSLKGRIGDSCILGAGCYANNNTCAISATGDGEYILQGVIAHAISCHMEYTGAGIQESCRYLVHEKTRKIKGDLGVIGIDSRGNIGIAFNTKRMHRAWISQGRPLQAFVYQ